MMNLSPLAGPGSVGGPRPAVATPASSGSGAASLAAIPASASLTLAQVGEVLNMPTYSPLGLTGATPPAWERTSSDPISSLMAGNFSTGSLAGRFQGLGAALLSRFKGDGDGGFSQAVFRSAPGTPENPDVSALDAATASQLHSTPDNEITLDITTASGAKVHLSLGSQDDGDGLAVQLTVSDGELSDTERAALAKLSDAFQSAIDGATGQPPKIDVGGLMQFDPKVLSSVDFHASVKVDNSHSQTIDLHADAAQRSLHIDGPSGAVKVDVSLSNPAILGSAAQQAQAMARYLQQIDSAGSRGKGDPALMAMFKDAFTELNSNYGVAAPTQRSAAPGAIMLSDADHSLLTGLADFDASITQSPDASNPMRQDEVDAFSYQTSQSTSITGGQANRGITQQQKAHLTASYHEALAPDLQLKLGSDNTSQNYYYDRIDDDASSTAELAYDKGVLMKASLNQSASQSTHVQKYEKGQLVDDKTTPAEATKSWNLLELLKSGDKIGRPPTAQEIARQKQALATVGTLALLQSDPGTLRAETQPRLAG
jgi:hypothetical protein